MNTISDKELLNDLAEKEIELLKQLPQPIVRVCGPLTCDGPEGYERNAKRLETAELILERKQNTVWKFGATEDYIHSRDFSHQDIMEYFHKPILLSGLIKTAYFLPRWRESTGATRERELAEEVESIEIKEFPEDWFSGKA